METILRPMQRHEIWRAQYQMHRYLQHLSAAALEQRFTDVFLNFLTIQQDAKLGILPIGPEGEAWMILFTHLLEEFGLRYGPYPNGFTNGFMKSASIPIPGTPIAQSAAAALRVHKSLTSDQVVKYGLREHLNAFIDYGRVRISPASAYADPSLNHAIHDDELHLDFNPPPAEFTMEVFDHRTGKSKGKIRPLNDTISVGVNSNYFAYCVSSTLAPRLFIDFDYDACVIVNDWQAFGRKLFPAVEKHLPDWTGYFLVVQYLDPVNSRMVGVDVFRAKHFRYAYQKERRFVWLPPKPAIKLDPFFVELGSLRDSCELILI